MEPRGYLGICDDVIYNNSDILEDSYNKLNLHVKDKFWTT